MKKIYILFAIISMFMIQFNCISCIYAADKDNINFDNAKYSNVNNSKVSCGSGMVKDIPKNIPTTVHTVYMVIQIVVPVILVVMGMVTLIKAITSSKDDDIKKAQLAFVKKLIAGAIVFFSFVIVKLVVSVAADAGKTNKIINCADCFLNDVKKCK